MPRLGAARDYPAFRSSAQRKSLNCSRSVSFWNLPVEVRGIASTNTTSSGPARGDRSLGALDLDHVGTEIAQKLRTERPGEDAAEVDDADAGEGAGSHCFGVHGEDGRCAIVGSGAAAYAILVL